MYTDLFPPAGSNKRVIEESLFWQSPINARGVMGAQLVYTAAECHRLKSPLRAALKELDCQSRV